jgi:hypothetical protein
MRSAAAAVSAARISDPSGLSATGPKSSSMEDLGDGFHGLRQSGDGSDIT